MTIVEESRLQDSRVLGRQPSSFTTPPWPKCAPMWGQNAYSTAAWPSPSRKQTSSVPSADTECTRPCAMSAAEHTRNHPLGYGGGKAARRFARYRASLLSCERIDLISTGRSSMLTTAQRNARHSDAVRHVGGGSVNRSSVGVEDDADEEDTDAVHECASPAAAMIATATRGHACHVGSCRALPVRVSSEM